MGDKKRIKRSKQHHPQNQGTIGECGSSLDGLKICLKHRRRGGEYNLPWQTGYVDMTVDK